MGSLPVEAPRRLMAVQTGIRGRQLDVRGKASRWSEGKC